MSPVYKLQFAEMCYFGNAQYNVLVEDRNRATLLRKTLRPQFFADQVNLGAVALELPSISDTCKFALPVLSSPESGWMKELLGFPLERKERIQGQTFALDSNEKPPFTVDALLYPDNILQFIVFSGHKEIQKEARQTTDMKAFAKPSDC
ncbi:predicted protein [Sclerotinia sclerotiorum 1980 UF-70]|uniref:Uncharacterized protein n=1 Tax=Sclerotinia sclerotiorum (strain ATCC 18683 / 1980 / Ss-1) TaxID=665079 RepID=A7F0F6_SCLS1|nr:predicted protein [Sclerotinia sclerotiorum 1980 UF-70]EDN95198.1 predicted protein [Sclerotinia sclerotiorum 1980 UF-70]